MSDPFIYRVVNAAQDAGLELMWSADEGVVHVAVNCNDTFFWGCADAEEITPENIATFEQAVADLLAHGHLAGELFAARVRKQRPQGASYDECYPRETWRLFDACGPIYETGLGNPVDRTALDGKETKYERARKPKLQ